MSANDHTGGNLFSRQRRLRSSLFADAVSRLPKKTSFDYPIFKGMERDDGHSPPVLKRRNSRRNEALQGFKLIVHRDAERLKGPRGRMNAPMSPNVERLHNDFSELFCGGDCSNSTLSHDCASDLPRTSFLAELKDRIRKLALGQSVHQLGGG